MMKEIVSCFGCLIKGPKGLEINNSSFSHPCFRPSLADLQSQNPRRRPAMPAVLFNLID